MTKKKDKNVKKEGGHNNRQTALEKEQAAHPARQDQSISEGKGFKKG